MDFKVNMIELLILFNFYLMNGEIGKKDKECDLIFYLLSCLEGKAET